MTSPTYSIAVFVDDYGDYSLTADEVIEQNENDRPVRISIVDQYGNAIYRRRDRVKMGFIHE